MGAGDWAGHCHWLTSRSRSIDCTDKHTDTLGFQKAERDVFALFVENDRSNSVITEIVQTNYIQQKIKS